MRIALFVLLTGCAQQQQWAWYKEGSTRQMYDMESGQCSAQAYGSPGMNMMQVAMVYQSCMQGKGWYSKPVPPKPE